MIEFINVVKKYPNGTVAINELSFNVSDGEALFIHGKTDSGKTTLRKLMLLEEKVTSGDIYFDEVPISKIRTGNIYRHRRKIGVVFRESRLFVHKTLYENFLFVLRAVDYRGRALKEKARKLLEFAGLWELRKSYPEMLTPVQRQRAEIARALATDPKIIIADEPTASLDVQGGLEILGMLMKLNAAGKTVIIFTKDEELSEQFGKRMITLDFGEVVSDRPELRESTEVKNEAV
ncbi:MAG: ATP-binding cassette domain-containing protein [Ruminococcaceae bacterium]|nr:ATP-binding cassette domain-containing protein [Oscillospiraceae bacterium]